MSGRSIFRRKTEQPEISGLNCLIFLVFFFLPRFMINDPRHWGQ